MTEQQVMRMALEAMEYADACLKKQLTTKTKHEYAQDLLLEAGTALRQALGLSEGGDCDSPSWCKHYKKCHRKVVGSPTLANCIDEQQPVSPELATLIDENQRLRAELKFNGSEPADTVDWKDMYQKEKRKSEMWVAKYEKDIGSLEKAVPMQQQDEPVAWMLGDKLYNTQQFYFMGGAYPNQIPLYTRPQPAAWVGLTDEEAQKTFAKHNCDISTHLAGILARAIEAALRSKNT